MVIRMRRVYPEYNFEFVRRGWIMKKRLFLLLMTGILFLAGCTVSSSKEGNSTGVLEKSDESKQQTEGEEQEETVETAETDTKQTEGGRYQWQEISIVLPKDWEDRSVIVENENGFSIYQKTSYDKEQYTGFICGFSRMEEFVNYGAGESMVAYTDDRKMYYLMQPTDFSVDEKDKTVCEEYMAMCGDVMEIKDSLQIALSDVHYDAQEYVLPISGLIPLKEEMIENFSDNELWLARNEIYARHGRKFKNNYLQCYFNRCTWYEGTIEPDQFSEDDLSQIERDNLKLLVAAEESYEQEHPYPKEYQISETAVEDLSGDGTPNKITYKVNEMEDGNYECVVTIDGKDYRISELAYMVNPVTDAFYITDLSEYDEKLEIAVLDEGPSADPITSFFRYDGTLSYIGQVPGFPFKQRNNGVNGFNGLSGITGYLRTDLIETAYLSGYWWYDSENDFITYQSTGWNEFLPTNGHVLYEDLPVHYAMDETSAVTMIPAQKEVFFLGSDMYEWILVKGKDGSMGYMRVKDGEILALGKPADEVFSDLYYFD